MQTPLLHFNHLSEKISSHLSITAFDNKIMEQ